MNSDNGADRRITHQHREDHTHNRTLLRRGVEALDTVVTERCRPVRTG
jgi:hypothetical protein